MYMECKDSDQTKPVRIYAMKDDMRRYTLDLTQFCGDQEKVMRLAKKVENMVAEEGLTCEEALTLPAVLYMLMESNTREQLNVRKYSADITSGT